jgi:hypothetical protein
MNDESLEYLLYVRGMDSVWCCHEQTAWVYHSGEVQPKRAYLYTSEVLKGTDTGSILSDVL